jgi:hypothetical protein
LSYRRDTPDDEKHTKESAGKAPEDLARALFLFFIRRMLA